MLPRRGEDNVSGFPTVKTEKSFFFLIMLCLFNIIPKLLKWLILRNEKGEITTHIKKVQNNRKFLHNSKLMIFKAWMKTISIKVELTQE